MKGDDWLNRLSELEPIPLGCRWDHIRKLDWLHDLDKERLLELGATCGPKTEFYIRLKKHFQPEDVPRILSSFKTNVRNQLQILLVLCPPFVDTTTALTILRACSLEFDRFTGFLYLQNSFDDSVVLELVNLFMTPLNRLGVLEVFGTKEPILGVEELCRVVETFPMDHHKRRALKLLHAQLHRNETQNVLQFSRLFVKDSQRLKFLKELGMANVCNEPGEMKLLLETFKKAKYQTLVASAKQDALRHDLQTRD